MTPELIEISEARRLVLEHCAPLDAETVPLGEALGRVLAEEVSSAEDVPAFDNSAMDGFAVRGADTRGATSQAPVLLRVVDESRAGSPPPPGSPPARRSPYPPARCCRVEPTLWCRSRTPRRATTGFESKPR